MNGLRKDWEKLDNAIELLEDGPIDYLTDGEQNTLYHILDTIELRIKDVLSVKELGNFKRR